MTYPPPWPALEAPPDIRALIPHAGAMCLLGSVAAWTPEAIRCRAISHLDPANPLRRDGRLSAVCGIEYALQAAALHGALLAGAPQPPGYVASLRIATLSAARLDDPALGALIVGAVREHGDANGLIYGITLHAAEGQVLLDGRATIALPG